MFHSFLRSHCGGPGRQARAEANGKGQVETRHLCFLLTFRSAVWLRSSRFQQLPFLLASTQMALAVCVRVRTLTHRCTETWAPEAPQQWLSVGAGVSCRAAPRRPGFRGWLLAWESVWPRPPHRCAVTFAKGAPSSGYFWLPWKMRALGQDSQSLGLWRGKRHLK